MKAIHLIHESGARLLVGHRPSDFDTKAYAEEKAEAMKQLNIIRVMEEPLIKSLSTQDLVSLIDELVAELRQRIEEPVVIHYSEGVGIEVRPASDDDRIIVLAKGRGDTIVNYQADGLAVDVFTEEEIVALCSNWFDNADLTAEDAEDEGVATAAPRFLTYDQHSGREAWVRYDEKSLTYDVFADKACEEYIGNADTESAAKVIAQDWFDDTAQTKPEGE